MNKIAVHSYSNDWEYSLSRLCDIRLEACLSNPFGYTDKQTLLLAVSKERWKELIDQTSGSLTAFIFILMFFETKNFRNAVGRNGDYYGGQQEENRKLILEIIYKNVANTPFNNRLSLEETEKIITRIGGYYAFDISTSLTQPKTI